MMINQSLLKKHEAAFPHVVFCSEMQELFIVTDLLNSKISFGILHFAFLARSPFSIRSYIGSMDALF